MARQQPEPGHLPRSPEPPQGVVEGHEGDRRIPARRVSRDRFDHHRRRLGSRTPQGAIPLQIAYIVLYLGMAFLVMRWNRGVLPLAAALAIVLLIFAAVSGPAWFDRDKAGLTDPTLDEDILACSPLILVPIQILLIGFAMRGFQQAWNVEVERTPRRAPRRRPTSRAGGRLALRSDELVESARPPRVAPPRSYGRSTSATRSRAGRGGW